MTHQHTIKRVLQILINHYIVYNNNDNQKYFNDYTKDIQSSADLFSLIRGSKRRDKEVLVIAGAIGSGKSTFLHNYLKIIGNRNQIILSPDLYMDKFFPDVDYLDAYYNTRRIIIQCYSECIRLGVSFIVEMVPAKKDKIELLQKLRENGYKIICCFLITKDVRININRINERVKNGAFMIPLRKIVNRYEETNNAKNPIDSMVDFFFLIDNSDNIKLLE